MSATRKVKYEGEWPSCSHPLFPDQQVPRGEVIDVPADLILCAHWHDAGAPTETPKAKTAKQEG